MGFNPSGRELNSASTQKVRSLTGSCAIWEKFSMSPSSSAASLRTANRYVLFSGAGSVHVSPFARSASRTASHCLRWSAIPLS